MLANADIEEVRDVAPRTTVIDMEAGRSRALARAAEALSLLGYDLLVVPRGAKVTVIEPISPAAEEPARDRVPGTKRR